VLKCHLHLCEAISGSLALRDPETRKLHSLTSFEQTAFVLGLQSLSTAQGGLAFHGKDSIACIVDMALYAMHNGESLRRLMTGVCVAARGIRNVREAAWFSKVAGSIESKTGLGEGNLRISLVLDTPEAVSNADGIARTLGSRLVSIRLDAESVALVAARSGDTSAIGSAENGAGNLAEDMKGISGIAHGLGVTCLWEGPAPTKALHLFKTAAIDGFSCQNQTDADQVIEAAEDAFDGDNQLSSSPSGKAPKGSKQEPWSDALDAFMSNLAKSYVSSETGIARNSDLAVGKLLQAHSQGELEEKSIRDALRGLRKEDIPAEVTSGLSSALRGLLRSGAAGTARLSTAMEQQAR